MGKNEKNDKILHDYKKNIDKVQDSILGLKEDLDLLQAKKEGQAVWTGPKAYDSLKSLLVQLEKDADLLLGLRSLEKEIDK